MYLLQIFRSQIKSRGHNLLKSVRNWYSTLQDFNLFEGRQWPAAAPAAQPAATNQTAQVPSDHGPANTGAATPY